jgi:hypothetical protein
MIGLLRSVIFVPVAIDTIPYLAGKSTALMTLETVESLMKAFKEISCIQFMAP